MVVIRCVGLWFSLAGKGLKLQKVVQLYSLLDLNFLFVSAAFVFQSRGQSLPSEDGKFELFWQRLELILSFHCTPGIRLLSNANHLPLWLSFCIRVALRLLFFSYKDDICMSNVFEKSDQLESLSEVCAWFVNAQMAWGLWKGLKALICQLCYIPSHEKLQN